MFQIYNDQNMLNSIRNSYLRVVGLIILGDDDIQILPGDLASDVNLGVVLVDEHQLFALVVKEN